MNAARRARQRANQALGDKVVHRTSHIGRGWARVRRVSVVERQPHPRHIQRMNPDHPPVLHVHDDGRVHRSGTPLPVNCPVCRPRGKRWDRGQAGKAV